MPAEQRMEGNLSSPRPAGALISAKNAEIKANRTLRCSIGNGCMTYKEGLKLDSKSGITYAEA